MNVLVTQSCPTFWRPHGLQPTRLLCPQNSPDKTTGVGCHFLLQGIFPTQGLNPGLLHCRQTLYWLSHQGIPFTLWRKKRKESEVAQSCPTLCNPVDCSLPGSSVHGILQARILEWVAISFSRGSSRPRDGTQVSRIGGRCFNLWATGEAQDLVRKDERTSYGLGETFYKPHISQRSSIQNT